MSPAQHIENTHKRQAANPFVEQFRVWLKHQLTTQKVSLRSLAQAVGIHHANLSTLWTRWNPSIKAMNRIAHGLGYRLELKFVPLTSEDKPTPTPGSTSPDSSPAVKGKAATAKATS